MFEIGDVVVLKSGGPEMTVNAARDQSDGTVAVNWFVGSELYEDVFDIAQLELADDQSEGLYDDELTDEEIDELLEDERKLKDASGR